MTLGPQVMLSAMVERLGPVIGGVLGCVPHVAVVGSIGFLLQTASSDEFRIAMLSMPLGMLCNGVLEVWNWEISPGGLVGLWFPVFWCDFFVEKEGKLERKFSCFQGKRLPWTLVGCIPPQLVLEIFGPLQASSSWVFDWPLFFRFARGKRLRVDSHFALLVELYVPGSFAN